MARKLVHIGTAAAAALDGLAADTGQTFQDLMEEAVTDLLKKHKRPVTLKEMLKGSLAQGKRKAAGKRTR